MDDYTPTTEEVRLAAHNRAFFPLFRDRVDFDRWLAAHDAEVRAQADSEIQTFREQYIPRLNDAEAALAEVRVGVVTEEPEWEYRWADQDGDHGWPFGFMDTEDGESLEEVQSAPANDPQPEYFDNMHIERRTKAVPAGPWVPVDQEVGSRT